jgi:hypothetical protein
MVGQPLLSECRLGNGYSIKRRRFEIVKNIIKTCYRNSEELHCYQESIVRKKSQDFRKVRPQDLYYHSCSNSLVSAFIDEYHASGDIIFLIAVKEYRF